MISRICASLSSLISAAALANPTVSDCDSGDAPTDYVLADCNGVCVATGTTVDCSLVDAADDNNEAWAVQDYMDAGNHDFAAWGRKSGVMFCCTIDDDPGNPAIETFIIHGSKYDGDTLGFQWPASPACCAADNLEPHGAQTLTGRIYGWDGPGGEKDGTDTIYGSDFIGASYFEYLDGEEDDDLIHGGGNRDMIWGGDGDDEIHGGPGNDRISGGDGVDALYGESGHDTLCDTPEWAGSQRFDGGNGNDTLWLAPGSGQGFDNASTGGDGTDRWGDSASWTQPPYTETPIQSEPATCPP